MSASLKIPSSNWIISPRQDLLWFSGSALFGYTLVALAFVQGGLPGKLVAGLAFALDGPHVYSTATRAVFDSAERRRIRWFWLLLLPLCLIGPLITFKFGFSVFFFGIAALSHWHIAKQHMGFVMIYKRKAGERHDFKTDRYFSLISLALPFMFYASAVLTQSVSLLPLFLIPAVLVAGWYAHRQIKNPPLNFPKVLLLSGIIPLTWLAWSFAAVEPSSPVRLLAAAVTTNIGHSFQYLKLMWFHNHNRYSERSGVLGVASRKWIYFIGFAVILALPNHLAGYAQDDLLSSFMLGFLLFHFVLDSRIWRIRGDRDLANALRL
jgi:hypothetical protein